MEDKGVGSAQRWEFVAQVRMTQLHHPLGPG